MKVITLGTGSPLPDPHRAGPSTLVRAGGYDFLFDCGRGVLMRLAAVGGGSRQLHRLLFTHLHSDHVTDFNDIITSHWTTSFAPASLQCIGPVGTQRFADRTIEMLRDDIGYRTAHHDDLTWEPSCEVVESAGGVVFDEGGVRIIATPTDHKPVHPTLGYRVEADGKAVVIGGDGVPCAGLDELCAGADVYVQTVLRIEMVKAIPVPRFQEILDYHSSIQDAAQTAARGGVGTLVLTHPIPTPLPGTEQEWITEAKEAGFEGTVILPTDLWEMEL